jgi:glycosyltransferase involved in cell wall biosynthesis
MNLWIQINCLNEQDQIVEAINDLPKKIKGITNIEVLIVNDGSTDKTVETAKKAGVKHFVHHSKNRGLPAAVNSGMKYAIEHGADILVNTDADGQYKGSDIKRLVTPIIEGKANYVYGERQIDDIQHFSWLKKQLQKAGARVVSALMGLNVIDAASGFRAMDREAIAKIYLLADFASPLESLIQARMKKLGIEVVDIHPRVTERESRIVKSTWKYVVKSATIILDNYLIYRPLQFFATSGFALLLFGLIVALFRYMLVIIPNNNNSHLTLLTIAIMSFVFGVQLFFFGLNARLLRANRLQNEEIFYRKNFNYKK